MNTDKPMQQMEYGLIGESLDHSFSPQIHRQLGHYKYDLYPLKPEELKDFFETVTFRGLNVTAPHKKAVIPFCDALSPIAQRIGSVNTIVRRQDGSLYGDNTDYVGLLYALIRSEIDLLNKKVLILGSGGASLTAQTVAHDMDAAEVVIISRTGANHYGNLDLHSDAEIIINTTPVGMYPHTGNSPLDLSQFPNCVGVCDLIYNPMRTKLLLDAERLGIPCVGGLAMLVAQAKIASELFQGGPVPDGLTDKILSEIEFQLKNVVIIGMPGSGKTTLGAEVAHQLGRDFIDIDALIVRETGMSIEAFFKSQGEEAFRKLETQMMEKVCKESGHVIATGGGCVTIEQNHDLIRQNSVVVFLERDLDDLPTAGRPVSQSQSLQSLYEKRQPIYSALADVTVENREIDQAADDMTKGVSQSG